MRRPLALALLLALLTLPSAEGQQSRFRGSGNAGMGRYVVTITVVTTESHARLLSGDRHVVLVEETVVPGDPPRTPVVEIAWNKIRVVQ